MRRINYGRYSKQYAVIYIIYMMIGSFFHKCFWMNQGTERYIYLHFAEMPEQNELETEDNIMKVMNNLDEGFKESLSDLNCEVIFKKDGDKYRILFQTGGFEGIEASVQRSGKFHITPVEAT